MVITSHLKYTFRTAFFVLGILSGVFAQEPAAHRGYAISHETSEIKKEKTVSREASAAVAAQEERLTPLQQQARTYRAQGAQFQRIGNLDEAMAFYQKALEVDPAYAVACNDLGVIYEAKGLTDRAEKCYLMAIQIDPVYASPYANLALLCEGKRDLVMAAFYWGKRAALGDPADPWTAKAKQRFEDVRLVLGDSSLSLHEQEVLEFMSQTTARKTAVKEAEYEKVTRSKPAIVKKDPSLQQAKDLFWQAHVEYEAGNYEEALKKAVDAYLLDPENKNITDFIDKLQTMLLLK
jgi:tetratricopeptide (TPR) repeat protein